MSRRGHASEAHFEGKLGPAVSPELREFVTSEGRFFVPANALSQSSAGESFCVRPERLRILAEGLPADEGMNLVQGTLLHVACLGSEIHHAVTLESGRTLICVEQNRDQTIPAAGTRLRLAFRPTDCIFTA